VCFIEKKLRFFCPRSSEFTEYRRGHQTFFIALSDLQKGGWLGKVKKGKVHSTSNIGIIKGGNATNVVMDRLTLAAEARSHNTVFLERIVAEFKRAFEKACKKVKNSDGKSGRIYFRTHKEYDPFVLGKKEPCVLTMVAVLKRAGTVPKKGGEKSLLSICNAGLDANWTNANGIPTVTIGCGQRNPHTVKEHLIIKEYYEACRMAIELVNS